MTRGHLAMARENKARTKTQGFAVGANSGRTIPGTPGWEALLKQHKKGRTTPVTGKTNVRHGHFAQSTVSMTQPFRFPGTKGKKASVQHQPRRFASTAQKTRTQADVSCPFVSSVSTMHRRASPLAVPPSPRWSYLFALFSSASVTLWICFHVILSVFSLAVETSRSTRQLVEAEGRGGGGKERYMHTWSGWNKNLSAQCVLKVMRDAPLTPQHMLKS